MAWQTEHSADSKAPPEAVWERYTDVDNWSDWSKKGVEKSSLEGHFEVGSKGMSKAPHLPKGKFELIVVEPDRKFVSKAKLPGATLYFEHIVEPADGGSRITHRAILDGPLSAVWSPAISRIIERGMPDSVERLAEVAVEKQKEARREKQEEKEKEERLKKADEQFKEEIEKTSLGAEDAGGASLPGSSKG
jgi:Polyketide cyclase / dehydrase and lipid transport